MIAIVPARGGSKGIPNKNIKLLSGKPLIYYTIKAAIESRCINRVIVSTDSPAIAEIAKSFGAEVPFLRPDELSEDNSRAIDAYLYTVEKLNSEFGEEIDDFAVLLPTSPLRTAKDIDNAVEIYFRNKAETVISVVEAEHPPVWYKKINSEGVLEDFFESSDSSLNRQEAEETYLPNGAIYIFNYRSLKRNYSYYNEKTYPYVMNIESSVDIDTELDFCIAELLINSSLKENNYKNERITEWKIIMESACTDWPTEFFLYAEALLATECEKRFLF